MSATALAAFAFITGFGSAITGTGGPVILVPLLLHAGVATPLAVAAGQIAVIPIALLASIGHVAAAEIPWRATVLVASVLAGAAFLGTLAGRRLDARRLRLLVGVILLVLALVYGIHLLRSSSVI